MSFLIVYILLGLAVGFIGGYAGIGGAPFMVAFLVLVLGIPQLTAQGIVLTMMLGPMSLLGVLTMKKEVLSQLKNISIGVISYAFFSYFGALFAFQLGEFSLQHYFAYFLILVAIMELIPYDKLFSQKEKKGRTIHPRWMLIIGSIIGIVGGLFGIGAGVLMVPVFTIIFHLEKNYARALSLAILLPPVSIGAFIKYYNEGVIYWNISLVLFVSYFIANYFGAKIGSKAKLSVFKKVYGVLLFIIAIFYFL